MAVGAVFRYIDVAAAWDMPWVPRMLVYLFMEKLLHNAIIFKLCK